MKTLTRRLLNTWLVFCSGLLVGLVVCGMLMESGYSAWVVSFSNWKLMVPLAIAALLFPRILLGVFRRKSSGHHRTNDPLTGESTVDKGEP